MIWIYRMWCLLKINVIDLMCKYIVICLWVKYEFMVFMFLFNESENFSFKL